MHRASTLSATLTAVALFTLVYPAPLAALWLAVEMGWCA